MCNNDPTIQSFVKQFNGLILCNNKSIVQHTGNTSIMTAFIYLFACQSTHTLISNMFASQSTYPPYSALLLFMLFMCTSIVYIVVYIFYFLFSIFSIMHRFLHTYYFIPFLLILY